MFKLFCQLSWLQPITTRAALKEELKLLAKERLRAVAKCHRAVVEVEYHDNLISQYQDELNILEEADVKN